ncbi:MAG: hypothetical protein R2765_09830 [Ferruginibacter sp.]
MKVAPKEPTGVFTYVSVGQPAKRLSTAFDSVTLYGEDRSRPDIYGKVGNSGVSIAVDDAKNYTVVLICAMLKHLQHDHQRPHRTHTLAFFMNAAIDQRIEKNILLSII